MRLCDIKRRKPLTYEDAKKVLVASSRKVDLFDGNEKWGIHVVLDKDLHAFKKTTYRPPYSYWSDPQSDMSIVNLVIPKGSRVYIGEIWPRGLQSVNYKARASQALVHSIFDLSGKEVEKAYSLYDSLYSYTAGKLKRPDHPFDMDFDTCSSGVHFFLDIGSALAYRHR